MRNQHRNYTFIVFSGALNSSPTKDGGNESHVESWHCPARARGGEGFWYFVEMRKKVTQIDGMGDVLVSLVPYGSFKIWKYPLVHKRSNSLDLSSVCGLGFFWVRFLGFSCLFFWTCLEIRYRNRFGNICGYCAYCFTVMSCGSWRMAWRKKYIFIDMYTYTHTRTRAHSYTHIQKVKHNAPCSNVFCLEWFVYQRKKIHSSSTVVKIPGQLLIMKLFPLYLHEVDIPRG